MSPCLAACLKAILLVGITMPAVPAATAFGCMPTTCTHTHTLCLACCCCSPVQAHPTMNLLSPTTSACCLPRLRSLALIVQAFTAADPLPAVQPGALPRLTELTMEMMAQRQPVPLPASWGSPDVWPSLRELHITSPIALPLPPDWAHGFSELQTLFLDSNLKPNLSRTAADAEHPNIPDGPTHPPPAEWGRGFPRLQSLTLAYLGLNGTFPAAWQASGSFPELREL